MSSMEIADGFKKSMSEWISIKKDLNGARESMRALNNNEKELRSKVKGYMSEKEIDACNLKSGEKVTIKTRTTKSGFNERVIEAGLTEYFKGVPGNVVSAMEHVRAAREEKTTTVLTLAAAKK